MALMTNSSHAYRLKCLDYRLDLDSKVSPPTIELVHPQYALGPISAFLAMSELLGSFIITYEIQRWPRFVL